ncbi:MAG TPA: hypothetical protein VGH73_24595 [Thermoanaerobaculia bacterium]
METPREERWLRALFFTLSLLYIVPFWIVHYLPTVDGPCHTYNAWILRQYGNVRQFPLFRQFYEINAEPYPNWIGHGLMALLMRAVPPLVAEKLLVSGYALTFLAGVWYLAGSVKPGSRWRAFLAFPFVFNFMFQFGFYNFSISLALFPWVLGFWWRYRERPGSVRYVVGINLLLWLCYFSHILSFALSLLAIAVLWLATLRRDDWRRHFGHVAALAPQGFLPIWYFAMEGGDTLASYWPFKRLFYYFVRLGALYTFGDFQRQLAEGLAPAFLVLLLLTLWREGFRRPWRERHAFLLLAGVFTLIYFLSPEGMSGGTMLKNRLCLYPYLILIPWLAPPFGERARRIGVATLAVVALLNLGDVIHWYRTLSGDMDRYLAGLDPVRPNSRVLPLLFSHEARGARLDFLGHAMDYKALEKGLIDWDNYEATSTHFPTRFQDSAPMPDTGRIEAEPGRLPMKTWKRLADYVYTWRLPPDHPFRGRLERFYRPVSSTGDGVLWERTGG